MRTSGGEAGPADGDRELPAWRDHTPGESRWPGSLAVLVAIAMQLALPSRVAIQPRWLIPGLEVLLLAAIVAVNPRRINRRSQGIRLASMALTLLVSGANAFSAARLVGDLVVGSHKTTASQLLITGGLIWFTNVLAFSLWYWELDRGGPAARAHGDRDHTDFLFPQMSEPQLAPRDWEPEYLDYLYLSFTNASAFSPTDVLPLSRWTKLTMMAQSLVSLTTLALVVARAVNTLR